MVVYRELQLQNLMSPCPEQRRKAGGDYGGAGVETLPVLTVGNQQEGGSVAFEHGDVLDNRFVVQPSDDVDQEMARSSPRVR